MLRSIEVEAYFEPSLCGWLTCTQEHLVLEQSRDDRRYDGAFG